MLIMIHEGKRNDVAAAEAYEELTEFNYEMKILKLKELEPQTRDSVVMEKSIQCKKLLDDLLDQQPAYYLTATSNPTTLSKCNANDNAFNPTAPSIRDVDVTDGYCVPDFQCGINIQRNGIPSMVLDNSRSLAVQVDNDSILNSSS